VHPSKVLPLLHIRKVLFLLKSPFSLHQHPGKNGIGVCTCLQSGLLPHHPNRYNALFAVGWGYVHGIFQPDFSRGAKPETTNILFCILSIEQLELVRSSILLELATVYSASISANPDNFVTALQIPNLSARREQ
jgi:hypothetical protein